VYPGRASSALPAILTGSLLLPYLLCCCGAIHFDALALVRLASLALAISLWYVILPAAMLLDAAFLALIGWVTLGHYFDGIYPRSSASTWTSSGRSACSMSSRWR